MLNCSYQIKTFPKNSLRTWAAIFAKRSKNHKIDNSQMGCKCYTRYKSNPLYKNSKINCRNRNPTIIGNSGFAYFPCIFIVFVVYS